MKRKMPKVLKHTAIIVMLLFTLYPVFMVVSNSLKTQAELYKSPIGLPADPQFSNYSKAITSGNLDRSFLVTFIITLISVIFICILGSFAAFALTRRKTKGFKAIYQVMITGMMIPYQVSMFQLFRVMDCLNLINSVPGLILVYSAWGMPFCIYVLYGFMRNISAEILEAAMMDGCSPWRMYSSIVMPLSASAVASSVIFNLVFVWNDLNFPMILVDDPKLKTLSNALLSFRGQYSSQYTLLFAGVVLASLPLVVVFLILQKKFTAGMMAGSVKG